MLILTIYLVNNEKISNPYKHEPCLWKYIYSINACGNSEYGLT